MNALILAAGYATRLYPLTRDRAKPLLPVAGKPIASWVADQLVPVPELESVYVVTNHKFVAAFEEWAETYRAKHSKVTFTVVDDGSTSDADKLGAIGDIQFAVNQHRLAKNDLLIIAGDNLLDQPLTDFVEFARERPATLAVYDVKSLEAAKKYNQLTTNPAGILTEFVEKPESPTNTLCGIALYYYRPEALALLNVYLEEGNNPDQPGRFVQWLHRRLDVFTFLIHGRWYDIGSHETLAEANRIFGGPVQ
jgi:glucose-1-phosphate thymidylyltransferase